MASGEENLKSAGGSRWPSKEARLLADGPHSLIRQKKKNLIANKLVLEAYQEERPTQMFAVANGQAFPVPLGGTQSQSVTEAGIATQVLTSKLSFSTQFIHNYG